MKRFFASEEELIYCKGEEEHVTAVRMNVRMWQDNYLLVWQRIQEKRKKKNLNKCQQEINKYKIEGDKNKPMQKGM